jgi:mannan endo-1,4-beta-mannosidase
MKSMHPKPMSPGATDIFRIFSKKHCIPLSMTQAVQGLNVWTFSGEGRPKHPGEFWQKGDPLTGDPPHELQGWYGIYDSDTSTIRLIEKYADRFCQF